MGRPFMRHTLNESQDVSDTRSEGYLESEGDYDSEADEDHTVSFRCKSLCDGAKTLSEMTAMLQTAAEHLLQMQSEGYVLDPRFADDYAMIYEPGHAPRPRKHMTIRMTHSWRPVYTRSCRRNIFRYLHQNNRRLLPTSPKSPASRSHEQIPDAPGKQATETLWPVSRDAPLTRTVCMNLRDFLRINPVKSFSYAIRADRTICPNLQIEVEKLCPGDSRAAPFTRTVCMNLRDYLLKNFLGLCNSCKRLNFSSIFGKGKSEDCVLRFMRGIVLLYAQNESQGLSSNTSRGFMR